MLGRRLVLHFANTLANFAHTQADRSLAVAAQRAASFRAATARERSAEIRDRISGTVYLVHRDRPSGADLSRRTTGARPQNSAYGAEFLKAFAQSVEPWQFKKFTPAARQLADNVMEITMLFETR